MFLRKKFQIAYWCELEPEIHVKLEQKRKPPIVMTKRMRASGRQTPSSSRPCIFLQCRRVGTKQTLPQASSYHNKTILPSSYLTPFDTTHTIPPQISTLASPATTSFPPHNHISPHTHTHAPRETKGCARCARFSDKQTLCSHPAVCETSSSTP